LKKYTHRGPQKGNEKDGSACLTLSRLATENSPGDLFVPQKRISKDQNIISDLQ
jgi:hypothetical protein